ncbi:MULTISPECIES: ThuA domain-containing protein [unclassified Chelatococcus]|uniref:ThuA domain-containing protein n=1 Tax=unclassified Chelatococcus TaxID=2638111 RepID=UPI001BCBD901|nr:MULTISPECIES: ThuA domain-containing protein [unclassified Chelatococcus]MBS7700663.1 ThuA domain-containing protein [Chelatococcus sp. YT9]MBX3559094.1 ThuA domain-containing protein [Chelatococcus sp.]
MRVTIWNEFRHEKANPAVAAIYPQGIHSALEAGLARHDLGAIRTTTLDEPSQGLPDELLEQTDVLVWWGHRHHDEVSDDTATRVCARVHAGMGLVVLHSGHFSKVFKRLMGTPCTLKWRADGEREHIWTVDPSHPIATGIPAHFTLEREEMYGEPFAVPTPDEIVFLGWFKGGEAFRSGCCYKRGLGRIFYFQPGHETFPTYHDPTIIHVIANGIRWAAPVAMMENLFVNERVQPTEAIP